MSSKPVEEPDGFKIERELRELTERTRKLREELQGLVRGEVSMKDLTKGRLHVPPQRPPRKKQP